MVHICVEWLKTSQKSMGQAFHRSVCVTPFECAASAMLADYRVVSKLEYFSNFFIRQCVHAH